MVTVLAPPVNTNRLRTSKSLKKSGIPVGLWFTMTKEHSCLSALWKQWQYYPTTARPSSTSPNTEYCHQEKDYQRA